jgi:serine/alanine adding enzyme
VNLSVLQTYDVDLHVHLGPALPSGLPSPDVYFTQEYGRAASVSEDGEWVLLEAFDGAWQLPLIVRTLADGTKDAVSPYGYSGVFASPSLSGEQVQQAWSATVSCLRDLGVISVLLRHSPLVPQPSDLFGLPGLRSVVSGHPTVVLEPAERESAWSGLEKHCRNKIRKATKNGYTGSVRPAEDQDLMTGGAFRNLYEQTMDRLDAAAMYDFSDDYYKALLGGLGSSLLIAQVRDERGVVVSCNLLMRHAERLHSHLSCSNREDARMGSNNLLKWTSIEFAIDQGLSQFHLGGGLDARDSLFSFKHSFGGRELEYCVSGLVTDDQLYQAQVERRAKELDTTSEALLTSSYFPAYRGGTQ